MSSDVANVETEVNDAGIPDGVEPELNDNESVLSGDGGDVDTAHAEEFDENIDPESGLSWEDQAKAQGWNPDFDGPGAKTAREFVEFGRNVIAPQMKREKDELKKDRDNLARIKAHDECPT